MANFLHDGVWFGLYDVKTHWDWLEAGNQCDLCEPSLSLIQAQEQHENIDIDL